MLEKREPQETNVWPPAAKIVHEFLNMVCIRLKLAVQRSTHFDRPFSAHFRFVQVEMFDILQHIGGVHGKVSRIKKELSEARKIILGRGIDVSSIKRIPDASWQVVYYRSDKPKQHKEQGNEEEWLEGTCKLKNWRAGFMGMILDVFHDNVFIGDWRQRFILHCVCKQLVRGDLNLGQSGAGCRQDYRRFYFQKVVGFIRWRGGWRCVASISKLMRQNTLDHLQCRFALFDNSVTYGDSRGWWSNDSSIGRLVDGKSKGKRKS